MGKPRVVPENDVVGHCEDVEAVLAVEVDQLGKGESSVAPTRVRMELAKERLEFPAHPPPGCVKRIRTGAKSGYATGESR
jgi:hypothetical protein